MNNKVPLDYRVRYEPTKNQLTTYVPPDSYLERFKQERKDPITSAHRSTHTSYESETRILTWNAADSTMRLFEQRKRYNRSEKEYRG